MADSEISVKVVADLEEIKKSLGEISKATGAVKNVGGVNIDNLVGKLFVLKAGFSAATSVINETVKVIKGVTLDMALLGERAQQVEAGFLRLAEGAGISGERLNRAIKSAADGTIETTNLLQRSSELIVAFGRGAERIPELIGLSRNVAKSFGLEAEDAFNKLSEAIRGGNTRGLKALGIWVDSEEAIKKYAQANGLAVNELNETGRAQAILNAVLEKGRKSFGDAKNDTKSLGETFAELKNAISDALEKDGIRALNLFGKTLKSILNIATESVKQIGNAFSDTRSEAEKLTDKINDTNASLQRLKDLADKGIGDSSLTKSLEADLEKQEAALAKLSQLQKQQAVKSSAQESAPSEDIKNAEVINQRQRLENERKFNAEINSMRVQAANNAVAQAASLTELDAAQQERKSALEAQNEIKRQEIQANEILTNQQKNEMLFQQEILFHQQLAQIRMQEEQERIAALERQLAATDNFFQQAALSAQVNAARSAEAWRRSGGLGAVAMNSFQNRSIAAFDAMGRGAMSASEALKGAFFGMLGDVASAQGKTMVLASVWPPNPAALAAGFGLIALGGLLSSMGGKGSSLGGGGGVGGGGGGGGFGDMGGPSVNDAQQRRKEVTINIEGNYFESEQTKLAIVEAVRSASDATDFTVQQGNK